MPIIRNIQPILRDYLELRIAGSEGDQFVERALTLWDDIPSDIMLESFLLQALGESMPTIPQIAAGEEVAERLDEVRAALEAMHVWRARYETEVRRIFGHVVRHSYPAGELSEDDLRGLLLAIPVDEQMRVINDFFGRRSRSSSGPSTTASADLATSAEPETEMETPTTVPARKRPTRT